MDTTNHDCEYRDSAVRRDWQLSGAEETIGTRRPVTNTDDHTRAPARAVYTAVISDKCTFLRGKCIQLFVRTLHMLDSYSLLYIYIKKNSVYVLSTWRTLALSLCVCVYIYINLINPTLSLSTDQLSLALSIDKLYRSNSLSLSLYISFIDPSLCTYQDSLQNGLSLYKLYIQLSTDWTLSLYTTLCTLHRLDSLSTYIYIYRYKLLSIQLFVLSTGWTLSTYIHIYIYI